LTILDLKLAIAIPTSFLTENISFFRRFSTKPENSGIYIASLESRERKFLLTSSLKSALAAPDHILFVRDGTLMAQEFDLNRKELRGSPFRVKEGVATFANNVTPVLRSRTRAYWPMRQDRRSAILC
jgi:hypothetical protein